jgi:hypothetical protein
MSTYRIATEGVWISQSGNAVVALVNKIGSGKRVVIRNIEVAPLSRLNALPRAAMFRFCTVTGLAGGRPCTISKNDTSSASLGTVEVLRQGAYGTTTGTYRNVFVTRNQNASVALARLASATGKNTAGRRRSNSVGRWHRRRGDQPIVVRAGEAVALVDALKTTYSNVQLRCEFTLRNAATGATYRVSEHVSHLADNAAVMGVNNPSGSGITLEIIDVNIEELGTFDTPYLQMVPVGSVDPQSTADPRAQLVATKMDSADAALSSFVDAVTDAPLLPLGVPQQYLIDGSAGSPKGVSYLHTKDFVGPTWINVFPERLQVKNDGATSAAPDGLAPISGKMNRIKRKARRTDVVPVTLREGEGVAIVSAAETATAATAVPVSGWLSCEIVIDVEVTNLYAPQMQLTGLKNPTEIRVYNAGTQIELAGQENVTSGTFAWDYDYTVVSSVDISILSLGYQNTRLLNIPLTFAGATIPIQQQLDRQYLNP